MTTAVMDPPELVDDQGDAADGTDGLSVDPEAPFGRKPDGTPYKRDPKWRAGLAESLSRARAAKQPPQKAPSRSRTAKGTAGTAKASQPPTMDYRAAAGALIQLPQLLLVIAGKTTGNEALLLNAATVQLYSPQIVDVIVKGADHSETLAALLEKAMAVGPWGDAAVLAFAMGAQIACNHKLIPPNPELGVLGPEDLTARLQAQTAPAGA